MEAKVVLITGASSGIGEATAVHFAELGYKNLALVARREQKLRDVAEKCKLGGAEKVLLVPKDLSDPEKVCPEIVASVIAEFGRLDVLVSNAGIFIGGVSGRKLEAESFFKIMNLNVLAAAMLTKHALPHLQKTKGAIIYTSSNLSCMTCSGASLYCATKGALNQYAKCIALEEAPNGIRVNVICPGVTDTEMFEEIKTTYPKEKVDYWTKVMNPLSRPGTSQEIARLIAFVASEGNGFMTGAEILVDGGQKLTSSFDNFPA